MLFLGPPGFLCQVHKEALEEEGIINSNMRSSDSGEIANI